MSCQWHWQATNAVWRYNNLTRFADRGRKGALVETCGGLFLFCRHSYVEGRLRLAEKERQRVKAKAPAASATAAACGPSKQELEQLEAVANANMAALLQEEAVQKVRRGERLLTMLLAALLHALHPVLGPCVARGKKLLGQMSRVVEAGP